MHGNLTFPRGAGTKRHGSPWNGTSSIKTWTSPQRPPAQRPAGAANGGGTGSAAVSQIRPPRARTGAAAHSGALPGRPGSAASGLGGGNTGARLSTEPEPRVGRQRRTLSAPAVGQRRSPPAKKVASKKLSPDGKSSGVGNNSSSPAPVGTRAALQELLSDGGRRALPQLDPFNPPIAWRGQTNQAAILEATRLADCDPQLEVLTLPWSCPTTPRRQHAEPPPRAPGQERDARLIERAPPTAAVERTSPRNTSHPASRTHSPRAGSPRPSNASRPSSPKPTAGMMPSSSSPRCSPRPATGASSRAASPRGGNGSPRGGVANPSRGASPRLGKSQSQSQSQSGSPREMPPPPPQMRKGVPRAAALANGAPSAPSAIPPPPHISGLPPPSAPHPNGRRPAATPAAAPSTAPSSAPSLDKGGRGRLPRAGAGGSAGGATAAGAATEGGGADCSSGEESSASSDDEDATSKAIASLAAAAAAPPRGGGVALAMPPLGMPGLNKTMSMPALSLGGVTKGKGLALSLGVGKLDLSKLAPTVVEGDRPDEDGRRPPTPPGVVVERLRAAAAARAAEAAGASGGGSSGDPPRLTSSVSLPEVNISRALQELSISELSAALSHHSSHRASLLGGASWAVDSSELKFGRRLGAGAYGEVYEAEWRRSRVAVKRLLTVSPLEERAVREFFAEMEILSNARHDHIVRFLGGCVQPDNLCILFEFCPQSLYDLLRRTEAPLELKQVLTIARQVALGIYYLHSCKPPVLHLDLKSANVLLDAHGSAKVCDFGLAHLKLGADVRTERMGSPMWTAPEILKGAARNEKADTYSFGMLLFELLTRQLPYVGFAATQVVMGVITNLLPRPELPADASHYPEALAVLMRECWAFESSERPAFSTILDAIERVAKEAGLPFDGTLSS